MNKILVVAAALVLSGAAFAGAPTRTTMPVASASPAAASSNVGSSNWYVGAGVNYNAVTKQPDFKHKWGFGLFVGQRINNWFAHELNVSKIGNTNIAKSIYHTSYDVYGFLPIVKNVEAFAKGGISFLNYKDMSDAKYSRFALNYGVGVQYTYQQFGIRAAYTRITDNSDSAYTMMKDVVGLDAFYRLG